MWKRGRRADQGPDQTRHPQASGQLFSSYSLETGSWSWGFGTYLAAVCPASVCLAMNSSVLTCHLSLRPEKEIILAFLLLAHI